MQKNLVSVMMPAYNAEPYISHSITSLLAQTYPYWELIIVDDGSTDDTGEIAAGFADPRIKLIRQVNQGEAAARNTALQQMQGEYLAFLDADDLYLPDHLAGAVAFLNVQKAMAGVYTDGYYCNAADEIIKPLAARRRGPFTGDLFVEVVRGSNVFGPPLCVMLRRAPICTHGLRFDESITIGPDWVFFMDYAAVGHFGYVAQQSCCYRVHQTNITLRVDWQNRALELAKCRIHAIKHPRFNSVPLNVRTGVFYDLLINLLRAFPERQDAVVQWPEFLALPAHEQARLYRLLAGKSLIYGKHPPEIIARWLQQSRTLDSTDRNGALVAMLYHIHPGLCKWLLRLKSMREVDPMRLSPFADLMQENSV